MAMGSPSAILQLICPDRPGLVSELSGWVAANGGNIRHADHHTDAGAGLFLSRIEWGLEGFGLPRAAIAPATAALAARIEGEGQLHFSDAIPKVAIFVSRQDHCLVDLLWRTRSGELPMVVALVVSNHPDLADVAAGFAIPFVHLPVSAAHRAEAEEAQLALLEQRREAAAANNLLVKNPFNKQVEQDRKRALAALLARTPQQISEEHAVGGWFMLLGERCWAAEMMLGG
jgi:formyltetrahydrofolate deformylase